MNAYATMALLWASYGGLLVCYHLNKANVRSYLMATRRNGESRMWAAMRAEFKRAAAVAHANGEMTVDEQLALSDEELMVKLGYIRHRLRNSITLCVLDAAALVCLTVWLMEHVRPLLWPVGVSGAIIVPWALSKLTGLWYAMGQHQLATGLASLVPTALLIGFGG